MQRIVQIVYEIGDRVVVPYQNGQIWGTIMSQNDDGTWLIQTDEATNYPSTNISIATDSFVKQADNGEIGELTLVNPGVGWQVTPLVEQD